MYGFLWWASSSSMPWVIYLLTYYSTKLIKDLTTVTGVWDWAKFENFLPHDILQLIAGVRPPMQANGDDKVWWGWSKDDI